LKAKPCTAKNEASNEIISNAEISFLSILTQTPLH